MKPETLLRLYPGAWRERYGEEFIALLQQTGVGWRQVGDVTIAASRERVRAASRGLLSPEVSHQAARFAGFYSLAWMNVSALRAWIPELPGPVLHFLSLSGHQRVVTTFLMSALVSRIVDNWALPSADEVRPHRSTAQAIGVLSTGIALLVVGLLSIVPLISVQSPLAFGVIMTGQWFGRKRGALAATLHESQPGRTPPPSSITTLGLSA